MSAPSAATWASKAARSESCSRVKEWAAVPTVGMPYRRPASRFEVAVKPAMAAARAAATADSSCVRREPISAHGRPSATAVMREAAEATAES